MVENMWFELARREEIGDEIIVTTIEVFRDYISAYDALCELQNTSNDNYIINEYED
jgi:hypothetical protein